MLVSFTSSPRYQRCQRIFDRAYPNFVDAGRVYANQVAAAANTHMLLLDVGCGRMSLAADAIKNLRHATGIDLVHLDLQHNTSMNSISMAAAEHLPFPSDTFDIIISQWVVEHFEYPEISFTEMSRVLKPGGRLIFLTTNANNYIPLISRLVPERLQSFLIQRLLKRPSHESFPTYYRANTKRRIAKIAAQTGFEISNFFYIGNPFYMAFNVLAFRGALAFEKLTDRPSLQALKLYCVVTLCKKETT